jgi:hypothetical protein
MFRFSDYVTEVQLHYGNTFIIIDISSIDMKDS